MIACPDCGALAKYQTLISGNTFGSTIWSDTMRFSPMLPHPAPVVRCSACLYCYMLADAEKVGLFPPFKGRHADPDDKSETPRAWIDAPEVVEPSENEYYAAIDAGLHGDDKVKLRNLRILAWWRANEPYRGSKRMLRTTNGRSPDFRSNVLALAELLNDQKESDRILRAEIHRELGDFESARKWLDTAAEENSARLVALLRQLCDNGSTMVHDVTDTLDTNRRAAPASSGWCTVGCVLFILTVVGIIVYFCCK